MPPWHASESYGSFENDRRMPAEEIAVVKNWARAGATRGDSSKEPAPMKFVSGWQLPREPDLVIPMSDKPFEVLDIDKDAKVLRDEVPKQLQAIFDRMDKNTDGVLEKTELPQ